MVGGRCSRGRDKVERHLDKEADTAGGRGHPDVGGFVNRDRFFRRAENMVVIGGGKSGEFKSGGEKAKFRVGYFDTFSKKNKIL